MDQRHKLKKSDSVLIVVDVQDKLLHAIHDWETVLANCIKSVKFAQVLGVPVIFTEQYPKGLGPTNAGLAGLAEPFEPIEKTVFSCFGGPGFVEAVAATGARTLVIVGIEAHICVTQTALEALARGYNVHVAADCVGSRAPENRELGLARLRQAGATVTSLEMVLYEWLERSDGPDFKAVLPLIK